MWGDITMRHTFVSAFYYLTVISLCVTGHWPARSSAEERAFEGIGRHTRTVTTLSQEAQKFFNQGLAFLYAFNHDEALRSFQRASTFDPQCAAIHWAIALANGPHINFPLVDEPHAKSAWEALTEAKKWISTASPVERELIQALEARYANPQPEDRRPLDVAYAQAMRGVWQQYPHDPDVGALCAEAIMDVWPWDLWTLEGQPKDDTIELVSILETVLGLQPDHPLALHLYIHALEASPTPERGALAAAALRDLLPGLGHMVHMPSHIDVRLGHWLRAIESNERAIRADRAYQSLSPEQDFYRLYMAHNHHMLAFAAMMMGQNQRATQAIETMLAEIPESWLQKNAILADGMFAMPYEVHLRFGRWDAILAEPEPPAYLPITRAFRHFARGVAHAAKMEITEARAAQAHFLQSKATLPDTAMFVQNKASNVLAVAEAMLEGEILYREGKVDDALAALREAVQREDQLRYIEPPDWIQPVRHALGATLMDAGYYQDAEDVYRADLVRHPQNGWSLHGLSQSLRAQGKGTEADAVLSQFKAAWRLADTELTSSCFCLPGKEKVLPEQSGQAK
jgi:tetratricopeptide (TPR) repeat protein